MIIILLLVIGLTLWVKLSFAPWVKAAYQEELREVEAEIMLRRLAMEEERQAEIRELAHTIALVLKNQ